MKTLLSILALTFLVGCSASEDNTSTVIEENCDCVEEFYLRSPYVGGGGFTYEFIFSQPINFDCVNDTWGVYYPVSNQNYNMAKVVCE